MPPASREQIRINPRTLANLGIIDAETLAREAQEAHAAQRPLVGTLVRKGLIEPEDVFRAFADEQVLPYVTLEQIRPSADVLAMVQHNTARDHLIVPLTVTNDGRLLVAVTNPTRALKNSLEATLDYDLDYAIASEQTLKEKVREYYSQASEAAGLTISSTAVITDDVPALEDLLNAGGDDDQNVTRNVWLIILEGLQRGASDIHIEQIAKSLRVRYRVDGGLRVAKELVYTPAEGDRLIANIKVQSGLDPNERRLPQDGRLSLKYQGKKIDLRIAILPVASGVGGEKVVMRILASEMAGEPLDKLDFSAMNLKMLRAALRRPTGMILVTGPTGSGKSTTLYSGINEVATDGVNVMTAEDPVEYKFDGVNQVQINTDIDLTFARVLRSFLRADPDVILVGEIRDEETVQIATKAALTGHLVLSTLHTNSAALTVTRLIEMGLEPYVVADALTACLSQRLVRRLCRHCRIPYQPSLSEVETLSGQIPDTIPEVYAANPEGCRSCSKGYSGRLPVHELLPITKEIKQAIAEGRKAPEIEEMALRAGRMKTLTQDGWEKVVQGKTDIAEVAALSTGDDFGGFAEEEEPHIEQAPVSQPVG